MPSVNVSYGIPSPTHDISLSDGSTTYGLIFAKGGTRVLQELPLSPPAQSFEVEHRSWVGGNARRRYTDDPTGFYDSDFAWTLTEGRLFAVPQWRFASSLRNSETSLPSPNVALAWWKLYGNTPASRIARYLSISFTASASYNADKGYLWIRRRGTPGTLTFELCSDHATPGKPGTVLKTVTKTVSNITDTVSVYQLFDWSTTQALTSTVVYHIKIYGASTDDADDHWEILGNSAGTSSLYSADNSSWTSATISMFYRITDADINRQWKFFSLQGGLYAVSINDDGSTSVLKINGARGTATSGTSTTLTDTNQAMTTNVHAGSLIRLVDGTGDGQIRQVASNTSTAFTVTSAWDITPDSTSKYVIYSSEDWLTAAGTPGIGAVKDKPLVVNNIAYFPQGQSVNIRRMQVNATSHDFAADGTNKADILGVNLEGTAPLIYAANAATSKIKSAATQAWGVNLTFGTEKPIGGSEYRITNLTTFQKLLKVFKEDGVYTYNNGIVEKDGNNFSDVPDKTTGLGVGTQNGALWWGWAHSIVRQIGSSVDDMLNYKRGYDGIQEPRKGYVSCIVSAVGWMFFVIDGGTDSYSSIICWNGMGWHEIFRGWATGVRIRNAYWQGNLGGRGFLWFDVGGDLAYIKFPFLAANPLRDSTLAFQHEAVLITPTYDNGERALYKILGDLRVLVDTGTVEVDYQTNANTGTTNWTVLGSASTSPVTELPINIGGVYRVRFRFRLQATNTYTPCVLSGWQLTGRIMPPEKYQFLCTFRADSDAETKTDEPDHNPDDLYDWLKAQATAQTKLLLHSTVKSVDNNTTGRAVTVALPTKHVRSLDTEENKWTGEISVAILET
jgi:hypothetical protein